VPAGTDHTRIRHRLLVRYFLILAG
jgi:hypothetical protein